MKKFDIKWIATALFIFGGTICALKLDFMKWAFPCFVIAHTIFLYDFFRTHRNRPMILQNAYFLVINTIATFVWFLQ